VNQRKSTLAAFALTVCLAGPCAAQQAPVPPQTSAREACAEYFGCLEYGMLTEAQARTARGHPQFVEPPTAARGPHARELSAMPDLAVQASGIIASWRQ
jgi:hypothetical protein